MRKLLVTTCAVLIVALLVNVNRERLPAGVRQGIAVITLPFKVALLSAKEPERKIANPTPDTRVSQIADTWHAPRAGGRLHEGVDIFAKRGTAVHPVVAGYVVRVGENALGGNTVHLLGAGGRRYYYAHLDAYAPGLGVGDYVTPETIIGYVGTTGNAAGTPPHLHFGVYTPTGAINPLPLLTDE